MKNPREVTRSDVIMMIGIGLIASAVGIALGLWIDWFPTAAATQAAPIDTFYDVLIIISVPVFVLVTTVVLFSVFRFRMRAGEEELDGPPTHGNTRLEIIWTAIPSIIVTALCVYGASVLSEIDAAKADQIQVTAYAQQFAWDFEYTGSNGKKFLTEQMYVPCKPTTAATGDGAACSGQQIKFDIKAVDVIHSFWIPSMRMKQDAVPGITTHTKVNPNRIGSYPIVCAELCGIGHSIMRSTIHVVTPARYTAWLAAKSAAKTG
ncbi:MAG: cytochrome c oxidase subunit II [Actinobacteria bacterium]|uniref:cytochrome-c oxidase n=1 Tax=freshwater metagenome TaxID=449393 RepID=A0A6J7E290_9ZZZZ|nr:cytochrome c oxidase subunit II [Actinomycetota bacterium]